jgi:hypothetical protein
VSGGAGAVLALVGLGFTLLAITWSHRPTTSDIEQARHDSLMREVRRHGGGR